MRTLRGFVYRAADYFPAPRPWVARVGHGTWGDLDGMEYVATIGRYESRPEALAAVCQRLKDEAVVEDIVRRAEGKEAGA